MSACAVDAIGWAFRKVVTGALSPILELIGHSALTTPTLDQLPGVPELWDNSWGLVLAVYGFLITLAGIIVMSHESVQTRHSIKEIGPRIPIGFLAAALSLWVAEKMIEIANALSAAVSANGVRPPDIGGTLDHAIAGAVSGGLFMILMALLLIIAGLALLLVYVVRVVVTLLLMVTAPLFLMCHCLPHTDGIARWWWKAFSATLAIQVAQSLILIIATNTWLSSGVHLFGSSPLSALGTLLSTVVLFYLLFKIPFWFLSAAKLGNGGRSFLGGLIKTVIAAKTLGMLGGGGALLGSGRGGGIGARLLGGFGRGGAKTAARPRPMAQVLRPKHRAPGDPPWPPLPHVTPTPQRRAADLREAEQRRAAGIREAQQRRATEARVAEQRRAIGVRDARDADQRHAAAQGRSRVRSPEFRQPPPQVPLHDSPVLPATAARPDGPAFSAPPTADTPRRSKRLTAQNALAPRYQLAGGQRRRNPAPARPLRTAQVPPDLQFRPPTTEPEQPAPPPVRATQAAPAFRPPVPEPSVAASPPRTQRVNPPRFQPPQKG